MPNLHEMFSVRDAARIFEVHQETVKRWIRDEQLPAEKIGLMWWITADDLRNFERPQHPVRTK